ncbi:ABC transporter ATP-binding protein SaoA [Tindallia californiensis]|uniref:NitT/TauT family transport system ATP-binding protein n=1 Tax=Tindallia californiensis TaxID=159292 RepID=A0A1H3Q1V1_9FIRM|nr:ABC transporter ATP-binding protein SaoA [Tindallia californiensis]SDZ07474.1 NitT/TauT family transport system ATP-binding protein [Tindallia californiensis]
MEKLKAEKICKTYRNGKEINNVLKDIDITIKEGEFVSLLGPSGCGKTTMLTIMAGFQGADSGCIKVEDTVVTKPGPDRAFVFQGYALFPWKTVKDNILYPMKQQKVSKEQQEEKLQALLKLSNLEGKENLYPHQLSGGMKQRTAVARALACQPSVLLMDEPLGALDYQMRRKIQEDLERIFMEDKVTVVMVSHDIEEAVFMSDRVLLMSTNQGEIVENLEIDLERPRRREHKKYKEYIDHLTDLIQGADGEDKRKEDSQKPKLAV